MKLYRIVRGMGGVEVGRNVRADNVEDALRKDLRKEHDSMRAYNIKVGGAWVAPVIRVYEMVEVEFKQ